MSDISVFSELDDQIVVRGNIRVIAKAVPDPHEHVVQLADILMSCFPMAVRAECEAVDAAGRTIIVNGHTMVQKRLERATMPTVASKALNQTWLRSVAAPMATRSATDYYAACHREMRLLAPLLKGALDRWVQGRKLLAHQINDIDALSARVSKLSHPPLKIPDVNGPLSLNSPELTHPTAALISGISGNLLPRLLETNTNFAGLASFVADLLTKQLPGIVRDPDWDFIGGAPISAISKIEETLRNLNAVLGESARSSDALPILQKAANRAISGKALSKAAWLARRRAASRMTVLANALSSTIGQEGYSVSILQNDQVEDDGWLWPATQFLTIVNVEDLMEWVNLAPSLLPKLADVIDIGREAFLIGRCRGVLVPHFTYRIGGTFYPLPEFFKRWREVVGDPVIESHATSAVEEAISALETMSGILACTSGKLVNDIEASALNEAVSCFNQSTERLTGMIKSEDGEDLLPAMDRLLELAQRVQEETNDQNSSRSAERTLAAELAQLSLVNEDLVNIEQEQLNAYLLLAEIRLTALGWDLRQTAKKLEITTQH